MSTSIKVSSLFDKESSAKTGWFLPPYRWSTDCASMLAISKGGRRMHSSSLDPAEGLSLYAPSTHFFVNCCCSVGFHMRDEARVRIHDYRHLFAVHTLRRWYRDGEDLDAKLPLLATYLGHQHLSGTQRYLHLTAEIFPEIATRVNAAFGDVIPRRIER